MLKEYRCGDSLFSKVQSGNDIEELRGMIIGECNICVFTTVPWIFMGTSMPLTIKLSMNMNIFNNAVF
ncbi:hypothetical protein NXG27_14080 [Megasphaera paucivorans]